MKQSPHNRPTPVYNTSGEWAALIIRPYIYNTLGEWIGWLTLDDEVFDIDGHYVGWLSGGNRILRKRGSNKVEEREPPKPPPGLRAPATIPLPPLMPMLPYGVIDVLEDHPELLHTVDTGELKEDMN